MAKRSYKVGKGIDEYLATLDAVQAATPGAIGAAIYDGAKIVTDEIHKEIEGLPQRTPREKKQVQGLLDGLGISHMKVVNFVYDEKIGFDGYNNVITEKYPKGQPNAMLARAIVSGTSFSPKNDFIGRAIRRSRKEAENAMKAAVDKKIAEATKK